MLRLKNILSLITILSLSLIFASCGNDDNDEPTPTDSRFGEQNAIFSVTASADLLTAADVFCEYSDFEGNTNSVQITQENQNIVVSSSAAVFPADITARLVCRKNEYFVPDATKTLNFSWSLAAIGSVTSKDGLVLAECLPSTISFQYPVNPDALDNFFTIHSSDMAARTLSFRRALNNYTVSIP